MSYSFLKFFPMHDSFFEVKEEINRTVKHFLDIFTSDMPSHDGKALDGLKLTGGDRVGGPVSCEGQVTHTWEAFHPVPSTQ